MSRFIDLDAVVEDKFVEVKLGGETYTLPGTISTPRMLRWMTIETRFADAKGGDDFVAIMTDVYEDLLDLFRINHPDLAELPIAQEQIGPLFEGLMGSYTAEEDADPPTATPSPKSSRRSAPRKRTASRSTT